MAIGTIGALALGSVGSAAVGAVSANKAAKAQTAAANAANETQRYMFDRTVELTEPQRGAGNNALAVLQSELGIGPQQYRTDAGLDMRFAKAPDGGLGWEYQAKNGDWRMGSRTFDTSADRNAYFDRYKVGFETSPGYDFRRDEGMKAIERSAAARGLSLSGSTMKDAARFTDGLASSEYGNYWNRLAGLAGAGQTATNQQINAGQNYANAFGQNTMAAGQARASGYAGVNNAIQGGLNSGFNALGMYNSGMLGGNTGGNANVFDAPWASNGFWG